MLLFDFRPGWMGQILALAVVLMAGPALSWAGAETAAPSYLELQPLIDEAVRSNHDVLMRASKAQVATHRVPQAGAFPDPMVMIGYENDGTDKLTYDESPDSKWMFSLSQTFPFYGKRDLKTEMADRELDSQWEAFEAARLMTAEKVKAIYFDLFFAQKSIDLIRDRAGLFARVEDAALARYASGMGSQQDVLMAQTEKYMLKEREEMLLQKVQTLQSMMNLTVGREVDTPLDRTPPALEPTPFSMTKEQMKAHHLASPFVREKEKMLNAADARVRMAEREYYPDVTIGATYFLKDPQYDDMWNVTATFNIPIYYDRKQKNAVLEARAAQSEVEHDLDGVKLMLDATLRENLTMMKSADRIMDLYRNGLIPKAKQDVESALSAFATGKAEAIMVVSRLKSLVDLEILYWGQFAEREKAIARMLTITGTAEAAEPDKGSASGTETSTESKQGEPSETTK